MNKQLKKAIVDFILDNDKVFNLRNIVSEKFRAYIYDSQGEYLIGGEEVSIFIYGAVFLLS